MATHYVYNDPDVTRLAQGDVLRRSSELVKLLSLYHPHYAEHEDYRFFVVLTQSCDLVLRKGNKPKSPYIVIAAARTLEETLIREASKLQTEWQRHVKVIGDKQRGKLVEFLGKLIDNNQQGFFYLHEDHSVGIDISCCAVLSLSVALRSQHYQLLLDAKIAQLEDTFCAKLGWLIGDMYGRVGTTDWNNALPDNPAKNVIKGILNSTLTTVEEAKIKQGLSKLNQSHQIDLMTPNEILEHVKAETVKTNRQKFIEHAENASAKLKIVNQIGGRTVKAIRDSVELKQQIVSLLSATCLDGDVTEDNIDNLSNDVIRAVETLLSKVLTDENLPGRNEVISKFINSLLGDANIAAMLK